MRQLELLAIPDSSPRLAPLRPRGLPITAAAAYLGTTRRTIERLRAAGELAGYHIGRHAMIELGSLDAYVDTHRDVWKRGG
jgi:excisionase family DNA binding protein